MDIIPLKHQLKALNREKDIMAADSEDRVILTLKKTALGDKRKKHRKMQVKLSFELYYGFIIAKLPPPPLPPSPKSPIYGFP